LARMCGAAGAGLLPFDCRKPFQPTVAVSSSCSPAPLAEPPSRTASPLLAILAPAIDLARLRLPLICPLPYPSQAARSRTPNGDVTRVFLSGDSTIVHLSTRPINTYGTIHRRLGLLFTSTLPHCCRSPSAVFLRTPLPGRAFLSLSLRYDHPTPPHALSPTPTRSASSSFRFHCPSSARLFLDRSRLLPRVTPPVPQLRGADIRQNKRPRPQNTASTFDFTACPRNRHHVFTFAQRLG
jgi:hypothetical protein